MIFRMTDELSEEQKSKRKLKKRGLSSFLFFISAANKITKQSFLLMRVCIIYTKCFLLGISKKSLALIRLSYQNKAFHTFRFSFLLLVFFSRNPYDFLTDRMQEHSFLLFAIFMRSILFYHRFSGTLGSTTVNRILSFSLSAVIVP